MEQAAADLNLTLKDFLGFSVVGALIATIGSFIALYLKYVILARSFEQWKEGRSLNAIFDKYRKPIGIASLELSGRRYDIVKDKSRWNLEKNSLSLILEKTERPFLSTSGPYYYKYKLISNAYRLCCFLC